MKIDYTSNSRIECWENRDNHRLKYLQSVILGLLVGGELKDRVHLFGKLKNYDFWKSGVSYLGPSVWVLLEGGEDLLGHLLLLPGAAVHGGHHIVQQADVQLLVEVQQLVNGLLSEARHLSEAPSALCKVKTCVSCLAITS